MELADWRPDLAEGTLDVLARAFATNPLHVAAFGSRTTVAKNRAFFRTGLALFRGQSVVAIDGNRVVGFAHWVESPGCRLSPMQRLRVLPTLARGVGVRSIQRTASWLSVWATNDPTDRHWHFGPIGIDPDRQGDGIGRALMDRFCTVVDAVPSPAFLETDKPENVYFYERFGFEVIKRAQTIGTTTYFMVRPPRGGA